MSVEGSRITNSDIAEALQIVRDVAALNLTAVQWAAADATASAIADAIAADDSEALQEALADLELLGPTRLATETARRTGLSAPTRVKMLLRTLEQLRPPTDRSLFPVTVYLSDATVHEPVEAAVEALLASAGLTILERDTPVFGSWFRRMRATVGKAAHSPAAREAMRSAVHTVDTRLLLRPDAEVTALLLQNLGPVIGSLQPTKDAVVRVGAVLIVKIDWKVIVHQLTSGQQLLLDHNPDLETAPHTILAALGILGDDGADGSLTAVPPPSP